MTVYANVVNNNIKGVYDRLPSRWNGHENFDSLCLNDEIFMKNNDFVKIIKLDYQYDSTTHRLSDFPTYVINNGEVIENREILPILNITVSTEVNLSEIRHIRDKKMAEFEWRYSRYMRQTRLGIDPTDNLEKLDLYMQALADITKQSDLTNIIWPTYQE